MNSEKITEVVKKLVGEIQPYGASYIDDKRFENLKTICEVVNNLVIEIDRVSYENKDRQEFSMKQMADYASNFMTNTLNKHKIMLEKENLNKAESPQLNIGFSFTQEVEKEAYLMINAYGKIEAEKVAVCNANDWNKEINELKHYDGEKIKRMDDRKWFWLTVASAIKNWV